MFLRIIFSFLVLLLFSSCSKDDVIYKPAEKINPYVLYKEGVEAFERNDYFFANKKFLEAELNFEIVELAAKSSIMASFSLYGINFYGEAEENLKRYLKTYPSDKNVIYAEYLMAIIYFEQISDEKKDLEPLLKTEKQINYFINKYPNTDYATDLKFKNDLIRNQLAAKELFIAKFYITVQKWVPAISRLKIIVKKYDNTIFVEEALHRLVEIHYHIGLEKEAKKYAQVLGYNYNSGEWFEQSYKILNKNYKIKQKKQVIKNKKENSFFDKIIKMIK
jgi:outer membrane protein assembly factor BamD